MVTRFSTGVGVGDGVGSVTGELEGAVAGAEAFGEARAHTPTPAMTSTAAVIATMSLRRGNGRESHFVLSMFSCYPRYCGARDHREMGIDIRRQYGHRYPPRWMFGI